jgi:hypothetical protein
MPTKGKYTDAEIRIIESCVFKFVLGHGTIREGAEEASKQIWEKLGRSRDARSIEGKWHDIYDGLPLAKKQLFDGAVSKLEGMQKMGTILTSANITAISKEKHMAAFSVASRLAARVPRTSKAPVPLARIEILEKQLSSLGQDVDGLSQEVKLQRKSLLQIQKCLGSRKGMN